MPEIRLTDAQLERLEAVRTELEAAYVVGYGHVRQSDALDYLLDTYTPPADRLTDVVTDASYEALQHVAASVEGVPGSGIGKEEMRQQLLDTLGRTRLAGRLTQLDEETLEATGDAATDADAADTESSASEPPADEAADTSAGDTDEQAAAEAGASTDDTGESESQAQPKGSAAGPGGGGSALQAVAQLLEQNDDVWRESDGETRYEVDLPDGTTEPCRTKDDVKRLLFKHYR